MNNSVTACRSCGAADLTMVLSLGRTPLANALLTAEQLAQPEETYPLDLVFCAACSLVQITETVPPEKMFREYLYFSSFSDTVLENAEEIATRMLGARHLDGDSLVMEIASNDGYLLQHYRRRGVPVLGIEPATNIARAAREERGIRTVSEFFGESLARTLREGGERPDIIHANNVLAHVADLNGFVAGIGLLLKDDGVAVIEVPYVKDLIDHVEFDTIYHEHLCYFSLTALDRLFRRHGLLIRDAERIAIHGGTLRIFAAQAAGDGDDGTAEAQRSAAVKTLLAEEAAWGVETPEFYLGFGERVEGLRASLVSLLGGLKAEGKRIAVYGASAKGSTLLNFFRLGRETLDFVVDRSTVKQGYYTPGTHLPIRAPEVLPAEMPDYVLLLTWNFADEILAQQSEYRARGGRFIIPIPAVRVV
ncbi:MAG TPA: class I SAM-dependent methyltransferase [Pyrinomonadaceae bacterium]|nr:class I SAM-dependent methyltransferase [Pyrinomonadaceae bacterium]